MKVSTSLLSFALVGASLFCLFFGSAVAHSWIECTDYKIDSQKDAEYYNPDKCRGYARDWHLFFNHIPGAVFGTDLSISDGTPYHFQGDESHTCVRPMANPPSDGYNSDFPMAKYKPGQKVCLAWPSKNHVAATCTNQYIPDTELKIFVSGPNPTSNPKQSEFNKHLVKDLTAHKNGVIDFKGFQNCPKFCENMDKSLCTGCFYVPTDLQPGAIYTFQWYWIFNPGTPAYTSCWEALIEEGDGKVEAAPEQNESEQEPEKESQRSAPQQQEEETNNNNNGGNRDSLQYKSTPRTIPKKQGSTFEVTMDYNTKSQKEIVVDILDRMTWAWYGKGTATVSGSGSVTIAVKVFDSIPNGGEYVLSATMSGNSQLQEMARVDLA